jgi:hypothetical protein
MGGQIDMAWLGVLCEMFGVTDPERLLLDLVAIRDHMTAKD